MQNTVIKEFQNDSRFVTAVFDEGEGLVSCQIFWTNFFLRDLLFMDPTRSGSGKYRQPSSGLPFGRTFIIDQNGKVVLPYFGYNPRLVISCLRALIREGLTCVPDAASISRAAGGKVSLQVDGSPARCGNVYVTAVTLSGVTPGTVIEGVVVPINMDGLTWAGLIASGSRLFPDFIGVLDTWGRSAPAFVPDPGEIPAVLIGQKFWFAAVTFDSGGVSTSPAAEVRIDK